MKKLFMAILCFVSLHASANSIDLVNFISLINTDFREQKFQNTLKPYSSKVELQKLEGGNIIFNLYKFRDEGLMINVVNNKVLSVILYKEGEKGFRQFNGKLPFKVSFTMNRGQIEKVIGPPIECIGATTINNVKIDLSCSYPYNDSVKFTVSYDSLDSLDYQTKPITMVFSSTLNKLTY
jgi:hypothetical protein